MSSVIASRIVCVGDLTPGHTGAWVECRTPDHGIIAGRLVGVERDDSPMKFRLVLEGAGGWTGAIPARVHSPVKVTSP